MTKEFTEDALWIKHEYEHVDILRILKGDYPGRSLFNFKSNLPIYNTWQAISKITSSVDSFPEFLVEKPLIKHA